MEHKLNQVNPQLLHSSKLHLDKLPQVEQVSCRAGLVETHDLLQTLGVHCTLFLF